MEETALVHYGVKGQKWGVRKRKTSSGKTKKKRRGLFAKKVKKKASTSSKESRSDAISKMSDDDLRKLVSRMQLEKQLRELSPRKKSLGQRFVSEVGKNIIIPAVEKAAKEMLTNEIKGFLETQIKKRTGKP